MKTMKNANKPWTHIFRNSRLGLECRINKDTCTAQLWNISIETSEPCFKAMAYELKPDVVEMNIQAFVDLNNEWERVA